jgi:hypothetical protein
MDDPFIQLTQKRPNSTTLAPNRDIDYVLTFGINVINISTMAPNFPTQSDHLSIVLDLDLGSPFPQHILICLLNYPVCLHRAIRNPLQPISTTSQNR